MVTSKGVDDSNTDKDDQFKKNKKLQMGGTGRNKVISIIRKNYEVFTKHQVFRVIQTICLQVMIVSPSAHDFLSLVYHKIIDDCPVKNYEINNADKMF